MPEYQLEIFDPDGALVAGFSDDGSLNTDGDNRVISFKAAKAIGPPGSPNSGSCEQLDFITSAPIGGADKFHTVELSLNGSRVWLGQLIRKQPIVGQAQQTAKGLIEFVKNNRWPGQSIFTVTASGTSSASGSPTQVSVTALEFDIPAGRTITFDEGGSDIDVTLNTFAAKGDTVLAVDSILTDISGGMTASTKYPSEPKARLLEVLAVSNLSPLVSTDASKIPDGLPRGFDLHENGRDEILGKILDRFASANGGIVGVDADGDIFFTQTDATRVHTSSLQEVGRRTPPADYTNFKNAFRVKTLTDDGAGNLIEETIYYINQDSVENDGVGYQWTEDTHEFEVDATVGVVDFARFTLVAHAGNDGDELNPQPSDLSNITDTDLGTHFEIPSIWMFTYSVHGQLLYGSHFLRLKPPSPIRIESYEISFEVLNSNMSHGGASADYLFRVLILGASLGFVKAFYSADYAAGTHTVSVGIPLPTYGGYVEEVRHVEFGWFLTKQVRLKEFTAIGTAGLNIDAVYNYKLAELAKEPISWSSNRNLQGGINPVEEYGAVGFELADESIKDVQVQRITYDFSGQAIITRYECGIKGALSGTAALLAALTKGNQRVQQALEFTEKVT